MRNEPKSSRRLVWSFFAFTAVLFCSMSLDAQIREELFKSSVFTPVNSFTTDVEGPAVYKDGMIYAVNFERQGTIGQVTPDGAGKIFLALPEKSIANGIRFDSKGNMIISDYADHHIFKVNMNTKKLTVLAYAPMMNQPNDIAVDSKNRLYASDPNFRARTGRVWRIDPDGKVTMLDSTGIGSANGIEVSPDEKTLYVNASRKVWAYDLSSKGDVSKRRTFIDLEAGSDGMRCDINGNLYITCIGNGTVVKVSPEGKILRTITLIGKKPTNIAFGGNDGRTAYVTLMDQANLETFRVDIPGREWQMQRKK